LNFFQIQNTRLPPGALGVVLFFGAIRGSQMITRFGGQAGIKLLASTGRLCGRRG